MFELKKYRGVCLIVLHIDSKFDGKLTYAFKNDISNLPNCQQNTFESLKFGTLIASFYPKCKMYEKSTSKIKK